MSHVAPQSIVLYNYNILSLYSNYFAFTLFEIIMK